MSLTPATSKQVPDHSIFDAYNKQTYLGNGYIYAVGNLELTNTSEAALWLLKNPAVTTKSFPANYVSLFVVLKNLTCLTASQNAIMRYYVGPTVSVAGTPVTVQNLRPASPNTAVGVLTTGPTASPNGTLVDTIGSNTLVTVESQLMVILDPGQSLLVTSIASSSTTYVAMSLSWYEL